MLKNNLEFSIEQSLIVSEKQEQEVTSDFMHVWASSVQSRSVRQEGEKEKQIRFKQTKDI